MVKNYSRRFGSCESVVNKLKIINWKRKEIRRKFISNEFEQCESELDIKLRANIVRPLNSIQRREQNGTIAHI